LDVPRLTLVGYRFDGLGLSIQVELLQVLVPHEVSKGKVSSSNYFNNFVGHSFAESIEWSTNDQTKVIEVVGGRNLALRDFVRNKDLQQFYLDAKTKTIKSVSYKG
jgi:hypothetical protein